MDPNAHGVSITLTRRWTDEENDVLKRSSTDVRPIQNKAFEWGIVGVDLDGIEAPESASNDTAVSVDRNLRAFTMPPDTEFASANPSLMNISKEPISIFDRFPEAFVSPSDEKGEDSLPYSWMVQNPGQTAKCLGSNSPRLQFAVARPDNNFPIHVEGETTMEAHFKKKLQNPYDYFFRATAFSCIMELNSQGLVHPTILASLIGRLFNGDLGFLRAFNRFFMPSGFRIEFATERAVIHDCLLQIGRHIDANPIHAYHPQIGILIRVLHHLAYTRVSKGVHLDETVGKLVISSNGREFRPGPGAYAMLQGPRLSRRFLNRLGNWWPWEEFPWRKADQLGLYTRLGEVKRKDPKDTLDPRLLVVRGEDRAWA